MATQLLTVDITASTQTKVDAIITSIALAMNNTGTKAEKIDAIKTTLTQYARNLYEQGEKLKTQEANKTSRETEMASITKG